MTKLNPLKTESYFLYYKEINTKSKIVYITTITTVLTLVFSLPFIYVDISIQARGIVQANIKRQPITVPFTGRLVINYLKENRHVHKSDTLMLFDVSSQLAAYRYNGHRLSILKNEIVDLNRLTLFDSTWLKKKQNLCSSTYIYDYESFEQTINSLNRKVEKSKVSYTRNLYLFKSRVISQTEYEDYEFNLMQQLDEVSTTIKNKRLEWQQQLQSATKEYEQLKTEQTRLKIEIDNAAVKANINGVVQQCIDLQPGNILFANQQLAEITPTTKLQVECTLAPSDIGYIKVGQKVKFQVDALNYLEWGMAKGKIVEISNDILTSTNQQIYFKVICSLDSDFLVLKNGYRINLKKGMTVNARMLLAKRSLFNLLFEKTDKWLNPYLKTNKYSNEY